MNFTAISRKYVDIALTARLSNGTVTAISPAPQVTLTPSRQPPNAATTWTNTTYSNGVARILLAGSAASPTSALVIPDDGADLWVKLVDGTEVDAVFVARIAIR